MSSRSGAGPAAIIEALGLEPLGFEGGFYRETWRSPFRVPREALAQHSGERSLGTAIYYLLGPDSRSLLHRLATDETYHFYLGDPVELTMIDPDGRVVSVRLGSDVLSGDTVQFTVPAGCWQGSSLVPGGRFALMGTTMCPGFELADFELGRRAELLEGQSDPQHRARIEALTPAVVVAGRFELVAASLDLLHAERRSSEALAAGLAVETVAADLYAPGGGVEGLLQAHAAGEERDWRRWYVSWRPDGAPSALIGVVDLGGPPENGEVKLQLGDGIAQVRGVETALEAIVLRVFRDPRAAQIRAEGPDSVLRAGGFTPSGRTWIRGRPGVESPPGRH